MQNRRVTQLFGSFALAQWAAGFSNDALSFRCAGRTDGHKVLVPPEPPFLDGLDDQHEVSFCCQ
jgi:hypothetical protein